MSEDRLERVANSLTIKGDHSIAVPAGVVNSSSGEYLGSYSADAVENSMKKEAE